MEYKSIYKSPVGIIILTSDGICLTGLWFNTSRFLNLREINNNQINDELKIFEITKLWLDRYFAGEKPNLNEVPIRLVGSDFSMLVWNILKTIPYGKTITYGEIATIIMKQTNIKRMSAQAVGYAVGHNPISIIIPCHRVVGCKGNLTGYGGGLDIKIKLLQHEMVDVSTFYKPKNGNAL